MPTEVVHTIAASGGDYTNLYDWQAAQARDLVSADEIAVAEISGEITGPLTLSSGSWTTDATRYPVIRAAAGQEALGRISGSGFAKNTASRNAAPVISIQVPYARVEDVYVENTSTTGSSALTIDTGADGTRVTGCTMVNQVTSTNTALNALNINNVDDVQVSKCVGYLPAGANPVFRHNSGSSTTTYFLNCVGIGGSYGFEIRNGSVTEANWSFVINCAAIDHATNGFRYEWTDRIPSGTRNNASEDADAGDIPGSNSVTSISSADFNVGDYLGVSSGKLAGAGYDHSQFTTDINGNTISSWPIGLGIVSDPDPLAEIDGDLVAGQTRTITASYYDSAPTHVDLTDAQDNSITLPLTSIGSDQYTFDMPSMPSAGNDTSGLLYDGDSDVGTISVRVYNSTPEEYTLTEVALVPAGGYGVTTLESGFDTLIFQEWPESEPAAGWQFVYPTTGNTEINSLGEFQTDTEDAFTIMVIDLAGTWYGITLDPDTEQQVVVPVAPSTYTGINARKKQQLVSQAAKGSKSALDDIINAAPVDLPSAAISDISTGSGNLTAGERSKFNDVLEVLRKFVFIERS